MKEFEVIYPQGGKETLKRIDEFEKKPFRILPYRLDLKKFGPPSRIGRFYPIHQTDAWLIKLKSGTEFVVVLAHVLKFHEAKYFVGYKPENKVEVLRFLWSMRKEDYTGLQYWAPLYEKLGYVPD